MTGRNLLFGALLLSTLVFPAGAVASERGLYETAGTYALVWEQDVLGERTLQLSVHVSGEATRESKVWESCETCVAPPEIAPPLPLGLTIRVSHRCMSGGSSFLAKPTATVTPAPAPGSTTKEVVTFDVADTFPVRVDEAPFGRYCLVQNLSISRPNQECAEFFAPEICATEYETAKFVLGTGKLEYVPTRTSRCRSAREAAHRALARINTLASNLRRSPGFQPSKERRLEDLRRVYRYEINERVVGECR